ncbi:MAG: DUF368 domain-containing protein [Verrucomicrobiota bacterium]
MARKDTKSFAFGRWDLKPDDSRGKPLAMIRKDDIGALWKGAAMGAANVIPGVSGGTIAFITGIYERLINALKSFGVDAVKLLLKGKIGEFAKLTDLRFLIVLGIGAVLSVLTLAKVLKWAFAEHDLLVWAFFFGLIAASVPAVGLMVKKWSAGPIVALIVGLALATSMAFLGRADQNEGFFYLMICGVVAICSMIIPGLSGSFVLLLLGNYELIMLDAVNNLREDIGAAMKILIPVGLGAVAGLILLSRLLSWLFKNYHDFAVSLITGFVAGSLVIIWPWKDAVVETFTKEDGEVKEKIIGFENWRLPDVTSSGDLLAIGIAVIGFLAVWLIEKSGRKSEA